MAKGRPASPPPPITLPPRLMATPRPPLGRAKCRQIPYDLWLEPQKTQPIVRYSDTLCRSALRQSGARGQGSWRFPSLAALPMASRGTVMPRNTDHIKKGAFLIGSGVTVKATSATWKPNSAVPRVQAAATAKRQP